MQNTTHTQHNQTFRAKQIFRQAYIVSKQYQNGGPPMIRPGHVSMMRNTPVSSCSPHCRGISTLPVPVVATLYSSSRGFPVVGVEIFFLIIKIDSSVIGAVTPISTDSFTASLVATTVSTQACHVCVQQRCSFQEPEPPHYLRRRNRVHRSGQPQADPPLSSGA